MTRVRMPDGQEMTVNADPSDIEFIQKLIALNDAIAKEINIQAYSLFSEKSGDKESFNRLKALVSELHVLLSEAEVVET